MNQEPLQYNQYYHIYNRGNNRENIFIEQRNYSYFLKLYGKHIHPIVDTFAYCLLPNHFHIMTRTKSEIEQELYWQKYILPYLETPTRFHALEPSQAFRRLFIAYSRAVNKSSGRTGALFNRPFQRKPITNPAYFQNLVVYIHQNPQRHGLISDFRDWPWSSYQAFNTQQESKLQRTNVIDWFGGLAPMQESHDRTIAIDDFPDEEFT